MPTDQSASVQFYPRRAQTARRIVQSYNLPRGKDRLYLILRSALQLPQKMIVDITPSIDLHLDLDEYLQRWLFCHQLKDEPDYLLMGEILKEGDHLVDVGANIGIFSLIGSIAVGSSGKVYAVEASPSIRQLLERNLSLNKVKNVEVVPFALSDTGGEVKFYDSADGNLGSSSLSAEGNKAKPVIVPSRTLDSLLSDGTIKKCDVLKMDIEGAEPIALCGMKELFAQNKPRAVMIEVSETLLVHFSAKPSDVIGFFADQGYGWYQAVADGFRPLTNLDVKGHQNLWAILPDGVERKFLL